MMDIGYDRPLYILPFEERQSSKSPTAVPNGSAHLSMPGRNRSGRDRHQHIRSEHEQQ